ncbi:Sec-independent protein translocase protein TatB [Corynebacterium liangguodongii]|uniref:Sec-independent protein translocase protein TatB n=1 Tax=Corynebacterium liangguodongii TaxID=2079535 RepID=A0A2S0WDE9_9CORY|nr:Sec-independent protein translocase protein TatB [Corynebacterium liangguodongii]AWB83798.1 twin-arginine translocase subunit TatB [Corynebacterium liangguodongii]PWB98919.1 twin-arginine translocase subunit TatB [Corynebacterium liangguodongii]
MFSSIGWGEIFFIVIIGLIVIGPERLPEVIKDVRAGIYAARKAIANARKELDGELGGFDELRQPLSTVTEYAAMGPRKAITKVFLDGDESFFEDFDPRSQLGDASTAPPRPPAGSGPRPRPEQGAPAPKREGGASFSWADIT